jgi:hypothetical protein
MKYDSLVIKLTNEVFLADTTYNMAPHAPDMSGLVPYMVGAAVIVVILVGALFYGLYKALD